MNELELLAFRCPKQPRERILMVKDECRILMSDHATWSNSGQEEQRFLCCRRELIKHINGCIKHIVRWHWINNEHSWGHELLCNKCLGRRRNSHLLFFLIILTFNVSYNSKCSSASCCYYCRDRCNKANRRVMEMLIEQRVCTRPHKVLRKVQSPVCIYRECVISCL